jgi:hypothetical protein
MYFVLISKITSLGAHVLTLIISPKYQPVDDLVDQEEGKNEDPE